MESELPPLEPDGILAQIRTALPSRQDTVDAVRQLAEVARDLVPSATGAGISLIDEHGTCITTAATDEAVETADRLQYDLGEGPCLKAWDTATVQRIDDTADDPRWPHWSRPAATAGIRSVLSVPLTYHGYDMGAMKVYASAPHAFTEHEEQLLDLISGAAAVLLGSARAPDDLHRLGASLRQALADQRILQLAAGLLMGRHRMDEASAHARLLASAQDRGESVVRAAQRVLDGEVPQP